MSLDDGVAVLVGRNGAGKSAILEGFEAISLCAIGRFNQLMYDSESFPKILEIEILTPTDRRLEYRYEFTTLASSGEDLNFDDSDDSIDEKSEVSRFSWNDYCRYINEGEDHLWTTNNGVTTFNTGDAPIITVLGNTHSLRQSLPATSPIKLPNEMLWVYSLLRGVRLLGKTSIRQRTRRQPSQLRVSSKGISIRAFSLGDILARKILRLIGKDELSELESICQRVGLGSKISEQKFILSRDSGEKIENEDEEYISSVLLDGVNIGLLSDGTLRVLSILIEIIASSPNTTTIIEEPETQIHPGMLAKLLNEIETYSFGENLILSTHSPQVVSWTRPEKIILVHRDNGRTFVRKLGDDQIHNVIEYLSEEGELGEWIYSGVLDDE
ncbi:ATP-binding protein [Planktothrix agardhii 1806]|uniref:AAA family ATPase n=1 Tax=Planktothrix agardhii TaxID=1160 RepID=UPI001F3C0C53|nr:ATP-binding protein [Planktothrix agardhii]MCF3572644.1 ATP-binding protein [Planktothrix agardhii 1805]MCF3584267.1 ATP-binding protein [Planktothrix agardhii 1803]MCF3618140.1 ATP-binding protein [Planktothrix agardhii 1806]MCP9295706.1 ATP-binding protein [Planktothrix agardhii LY1]